MGAAAGGIQLDGEAGGAQVVGRAQRPGEVVSEGDAVEPGVLPQIALVSLRRGGGGGDAVAGHLSGQHAVTGGLADVNGLCGRAEVLPHAGGHGRGDAQRAAHGIPVLPVQISGARGGAQHTGDAAGVPAPAVQLGGAYPPELALYLRGQNEGLQHVLAGGCLLLAHGQHAGQHGHRGVAEVGGRRVVQLQLVAADAVEKGGVVGADGVLQTHQRAAAGCIIHRQQPFDNIGAAARQHRTHGIHDGALGQIAHLRVECRLPADKRRKDLAEIHRNFLLSWDHAAQVRRVGFAGKSRCAPHGKGAERTALLPYVRRKGSRFMPGRRPRPWTPACPPPLAGGLPRSDATPSAAPPAAGRCRSSPAPARGWGRR